MRNFLAEHLKADTLVTDFVDDRTYQGGSMNSTVPPQGKAPFLVYTIGNTSDEDLSEDPGPYRQFFIIYVHDKGEDYDQIDQIILALKRSLVNQKNLEYGVMTIRYLETSQDLDDQTMGTIMRYVRFQAIMQGR